MRRPIATLSLLAVVVLFATLSGCQDQQSSSDNYANIEGNAVEETYSPRANVNPEYNPNQDNLMPPDAEREPAPPTNSALVNMEF